MPPKISLKKRASAIPRQSTFSREQDALLARAGREFPEVARPSAVRAVLAIVHVGQRVEAAAADWLAPAKLTPPRFNALMAIWLAEPAALSLSELGSRMFTTRSNVTVVADALEREQLVERIAHPSDRRSILLAMTAKGRATLRGILPAHLAHVSDAVADLSEREQRQLERLLGRVSVRLSVPAGGARERAG